MFSHPLFKFCAHQSLRCPYPTSGTTYIIFFYKIQHEHVTVKVVVFGINILSGHLNIRYLNG